ATTRLNRPVGDAQPQARPASDGLRGEEGIEHFWQCVSRNTASMVLPGDHVLTTRRLRSNCDTLAGAACLHSIHDYIQNCLVQSGGIAAQQISRCKMALNGYPAGIEQRFQKTQARGNPLGGIALLDSR